jgi:hypothetical protein
VGSGAREAEVLGGSSGPALPLAEAFSADVVSRARARPCQRLGPPAGSALPGHDGVAEVLLRARDTPRAVAITAGTYADVGIPADGTTTDTAAIT